MRYQSLVRLLTFTAVTFLMGCSNGATKSPDVTDSVRRLLDQSNLHNVKVSQDRDKGVVTLTGQVAADTEKAQAESIAKSVAGLGVTCAGSWRDHSYFVRNDLRAVNSDLDKGIEKNLDATLVQNKLNKDVKYDVKNGVVTLTGEVNSQAKRGLETSVLCPRPFASLILVGRKRRTTNSTRNDESRVRRLPYT